MILDSYSLTLHALSSEFSSSLGYLSDNATTSCVNVSQEQQGSRWGLAVHLTWSIARTNIQVCKHITYQNSKLFDKKSTIHISNCSYQVGLKG